MPDAPTSRSSLNPRPEHEITLDQEVALRSAAVRLAEEFTGTFNAETIGRFLASSYDEFAGRATIVNYLPLLAERFARERLHALSRIEGLASDGRAAVLFLCTHNAGRSQMAMGFFSHHAGEAGIAWSGGTEPGIEVNPAAVAAMAERGIDISREYPKPWTDEVVRAADAVISMGCGDACPIFPGKRYEDWDIEDPEGRTHRGGATHPRRHRTTCADPAERAGHHSGGLGPPPRTRRGMEDASALTTNRVCDEGSTSVNIDACRTRLQDLSVASYRSSTTRSPVAFRWRTSR